MHTPQDDVLVGRHVLEHKLVSRDVLLDCLSQLVRERRTAGFARPLGVILVARGLLTEQQLAAILSDRTGTHRLAGDIEIGRLLVTAGGVSAEDVERCLQVQRREREAGRPAPPLGDLAIREGYATREQVARALTYQNRTAHACGGCGARITIVPAPPGHRYRCRKCNGEMAPVEVPASEGTPVHESGRSEENQLELDRAIGAYLKQKSMVRRDQMRDAQRLQLEFSQYGLVVPLTELLRKAGALTWQQERALEQVDFAAIVHGPEWAAQLIPGYKLHQRIAAGGYATIYTARAVFDGAGVAVKILSRDRAKDARAVARFEREAALLRRLAHPGIVRGLEYGCDKGHHYLVMEYVDGRSLGQTLSEGGALPVRNALKVARAIGDALRYLHAEGYLHRDIKPDNVLLTAAGAVKLCDLGFATPIPVGAEAEGKHAATVVGTAGYISPEQMRGDADVKVGADIYALGITLYALLTGYEPFKGVSSEEVVAEQIEGGLPVPNLMVVKAPPPVMQLLNRTLHADRMKRYRTVVDVIGELDRLLA